MDRAINHAD